MGVVHRLGMDTSGLVVFARTDAALRGMNALFRSRKVSRNYEALVCGHVADDSGDIDLPLMRDYECPPFMRVICRRTRRALSCSRLLQRLPAESQCASMPSQLASA